MKKLGFAAAVKKAINSNTDNWEAYYYMGEYVDEYECEWDPKKLAVYMQTRESALGPEWAELRKCIMQMQGLIPRIEESRGRCPKAVRYQQETG